MEWLLCSMLKKVRGQHLVPWKGPLKGGRNAIMSLVAPGAFEGSGLYLSHLPSAV